MTWTPAEVAARLAARERYRAEHPGFDDPDLRTSARAAKRAAERDQKRQRYADWWASLSDSEKAEFRRRKKGRGGKPLRRSRMETTRLRAILEGRPEPQEWQLREAVRNREREKRAAYNARREEAQREE
jgi:hypothetical protein